MNLKQAIQEQGDYKITITQTLKGVDQACYVETSVEGVDRNGDRVYYHNIDDDYYGADLSEVCGYDHNVPQSTIVMLSESIDWFFWDDKRFLSNFCVRRIARKYL